MLKLLCYSTLFFSIAQPVVLFPVFSDRAFFIVAGLALFCFAVTRIVQGMALGQLPQRKYVYTMVVVYALSIAQSGWLGGAAALFMTWAKVAMVFTLTADVGVSPRDVNRGVFAVVAAVAALTWVGWDLYLNAPELLTNPGRLESRGYYNLSNSFALALTMGSALAFSLLETQRGLLRKLPMVFLIVIFAVSNVNTKSRGGNLGFAVALLVSIILSRRIRSRAFKGLLVGAVIVAIVVSVPVIMSRSDALGYFGGDASAEDRLAAWWAALHMIWSHPLLGVGVGQFADYAVEYGANRKMTAHNTLLSVTAETGLLGGLFFVTDHRHDLPVAVARLAHRRARPGATRPCLTCTRRTYYAGRLLGQFQLLGQRRGPHALGDPGNRR